MFGPSQRTLNLGLENEGPCRKNIPIKGHDLNEEPAVNTRQLDRWRRVHLKVLCIEDCILILENGNRVEHLLHHIHLIYVTNQTEAIEHGHKNMREIELKQHVLSLWVYCKNIFRISLVICS
jgi:hypothetical protein